MEENTKNNYEIVSENFYKFINPNITTENNGVIYFNTDKSGSDNAYPEALINRYQQSSSVHASMINLKKRLTYGSGLYPTDENDDKLVDYLNKKNKYGDDFNDVYLKLCMDYSLSEMAAFQVLYSPNGKIQQIVHTDISNLRAERPNKYGQIEAWYYSADWVTVNGSISFSDRRLKKQKPVRIPVFNPEKFEKEPRQIVILKRYTTGNQIYTIPSYNAAIPAIDTDYELSQLNINMIKNGFLPSAIISLFGDPSPEEKRRFIDKFNRTQTGGKNVKALFQWIDDPEKKPIFERMAADPNADLFLALKEKVTQDIVTAHGGSLELAGIQSKGSDLGGDANKLNVARLSFIENVIKDNQRILLKGINNVLRHNKMGEVYVTNDPLKLTQPTQQPNDLTVDERRDILFGLPPLEEDIIEEDEVNVQ